MWWGGTWGLWDNWSRFQDAFEKGPVWGWGIPRLVWWGGECMCGVPLLHQFHLRAWEAASTSGASSTSFPKISLIPPLLSRGNLGLRKYKNAGWSLPSAVHPQAELEVGFSIPHYQKSKHNNSLEGALKACCWKVLLLCIALLVAVIQTLWCQCTP